MNKLREKIDEGIIKRTIVLQKKFEDSRFSLKNKNEGMGVIEVVLIILVLVGLALVFRSKITSLLNRIFSKINTSVNSF